MICLQSSGAHACRSVFLSRSLYIMICRAGPDLAGLAGRRVSHADGQTAVEGGRLGRRRGVGVGVARPVGVPGQRSAHLHLRPGQPVRSEARTLRERRRTGCSVHRLTDV
jgi:hypothetical protein